MVHVDARSARVAALATRRGRSAGDGGVPVGAPAAAVAANCRHGTQRRDGPRADAGRRRAPRRPPAPRWPHAIAHTSWTSSRWTIASSSRHPVQPVLADDPLCGLADAAAAAEGDNVAVTELVRRTQSAVWQVCAVLGSDGETEDLVQETYLRALACACHGFAAMHRCGCGCSRSPGGRVPTTFVAVNVSAGSSIG